MQTKKVALLIMLGACVLLVLNFVSKPVAPITNQGVASNLENPSEEKQQNIKTAENTNGKTLDLSGQGLEKLPPYVLSRTNLEELDISSNKLTGALPSEIGKLTKLKILRASSNLMTGVPAEIGHLPNLEILDLSNNKLTGLPNELANLKKLKILNLSGNDYSKQDLDVIKKGLPSTVNIIVN